MKKEVLTGLAALVLGTAAPGKAAADTYTYTDDYSSDTCVTESYQHDPFYPPVRERFLWLNEGTLQFHALGPAEPGVSDAELCYRFPIDHTTSGILSGTFDLDAVTTHWCGMGAQMHLEVLTSPDGQTWTLRYEATDEWGPMHIQFTLPDVGATHQYVKIRAYAMQIDNLAVHLDTDTLVSTDETTWSRIKSFYH